MRAVLVERFGDDPRIAQVPDPSPAPHGVVVAVEATGVCRSDWHAWQGHDSDVVLPHVPGHEFAGTVVEVGAGVRRFGVGDRVTMPFLGACGRCASCVAGHHEVCEHQVQPGSGAWGSHAELVALAAADVNLVRLPDSLSSVAAASLGCRVATAFRAVVDRGRVRPGEWVAVHGCGGVGLSAVLVAVASGARVVAVDVDPDALDLAVRLGAEVAVRGSRGGPDAGAGVADVPGAVVEATGGGAALSLDALGSQVTAANSLLGLARRGRHVQVGLLAADPVLPLGRVVSHELDVLGSHGMGAPAYPALLALVASGRLRPELLVGRVLGLADGPAALTAMSHPAAGAGMTVLDLTAG